MDFIFFFAGNCFLMPCTIVYMSTSSRPVHLPYRGEPVRYCYSKMLRRIRNENCANKIPFLSTVNRHAGSFQVFGDRQCLAISLILCNRKVRSFFHSLFFFLFFFFISIPIRHIAMLGGVAASHFSGPFAQRLHLPWARYSQTSVPMYYYPATESQTYGLWKWTENRTRLQIK